MSDNNKQTRKSNFESIEILRSRIKDGTFREIIQDWKWIFSYSKKYKGAIAFYVVLGLLSSTLGLVSSVATKYLIDIITGYQTDKLLMLIIIMVGGTMFSLLFNSIISRITAKLSIGINNDIQADIFDKIVDADWLAMSKYSSGDILNRFNNDVGTVSGNAIDWLPTVIIAAYNFLATFVVLMYYDVVMALLALLSTPFLLLMSKRIARKQREYLHQMRRMSSSMMTFEAETFYNFDTIKSFGISDQYSKKMRRWQKNHKKLHLDYNWFSIKTHTQISLLGTVVQLIAFGYCLILLWNHVITYGTMTLFLQQKNKLSTAFNNVVSIIPSFLNASVSAHRIRELVELPREVHNPEGFRMEDLAEDGFAVSMKDVAFSYEDAKEDSEDGRTVISESHFVAKPGEIVGLVGPSGEGKTTMIRLILGLIRPQSGQVTLTSSDGVEVPMSIETRHLFSYVPQGNAILSGTIAENLRMVKEDATEEEMIEALRIACAWEFVEKLPDTIHSSVGERGKGLSEGQAQRISIARAVLRDAPILLLDEATSALDVTTERRVLSNIIKERPNKTCIVTTHRPSVLNMCRRVYRVMDTKVTRLSEEESSRMAIDF